MASSMIEEWLKLLNLDQYAEAFFDNGYDDLEIAKQISDPDLDAIGVKDSEHREQILRAVKTLHDEGVSSLYFTLEPGDSDLERESSESDLDENTAASASCLETGKVSIPKLKLKMMIRNKLLSDSVNLCDTPYSNPDGSLGNIESLATVYAAEYSTYYRDVHDCIEELRRRKLAKDMGQIHSIPVEYGSASTQPASHPENAGIQGDQGEPLLASCTKSRFGGSRSQEINSDTTLSDGEGKKRTITISKIFKKSMYFKGKDKISKERGKSTTTGRVAVDEIIASEITMSDEERIQLMMQVKEGNMTVDQVLEKVKRYEAEKKKMKEKDEPHANSNSADELDENFVVAKPSSRLKVRMPSIRKKKKVHKDEDQKQSASYSSNYEKLGNYPGESVERTKEETTEGVGRRHEEMTEVVTGVTVTQEPVDAVEQNSNGAPAETMSANGQSEMNQDVSDEKPGGAADLKQDSDKARNYCVISPEEANQTEHGNANQKEQATAAGVGELQQEERAGPSTTLPNNSETAESEEGEMTAEREQQPVIQKSVQESAETDGCEVPKTTAAAAAPPVEPVPLPQPQSPPPSLSTLPPTTGEADETDGEHCQCSVSTAATQEKETGEEGLPGQEAVGMKEEETEMKEGKGQEKTEVKEDKRQDEKTEKEAEMPKEEEEVIECQEMAETSKSLPSFFDKVKKISRKLSVSSRSQNYSRSNSEGLISTGDQHSELVEDGKSNVYGSCESLRSSTSGNSQQSNQGSSQSQTNSSGSNRESTASQEEEVASPYTGPFCGRAKVHSDFIPSPYDTDSLKLKKGDIVQVISKPPMGTWVGLLNNKVGTFKFIYVDLVSDEEEESCRASKPRRKKGKSKLTPKVNNVEALLRKIGLEEYISVFSLNGYDTLDLFRNIEDEDLQELNITNTEHKIKLLTAAELLHDSEESEDEEIRKDGVLSEQELPPPSDTSTGPERPNVYKTFQAELCEKLSVVSPRDSGCYASNENLPKDNGSSGNGSGSASGSGSGNGTITKGAARGSRLQESTAMATAPPAVDEVRLSNDLMNAILENLPAHAPTPTPSDSKPPPLVRPKSSEELFSDTNIKQNFRLKRDYFEAKQGHRSSQSLSGLRKQDGSGSSSFHELVNLYEQTASEVDKAHKPVPMPRTNLQANKTQQTLELEQQLQHSLSAPPTAANNSGNLAEPSADSLVGPLDGTRHPQAVRRLHHHKAGIDLSVNLPKRHRPKSQSLSLEDQVSRKLQDEQIDLTLVPYTTNAGLYGIPFALVQRYSEELKSEAREVALALDSQRLAKLAKNNANGVALDLANLDGRVVVEGRETTMSVADWLTSLGLPMYAEALVSKGWDEVEFLGLISEEDLKSCGVNNPKHLKKILLAVESLKSK